MLNLSLPGPLFLIPHRDTHPADFYQPMPPLLLDQAGPPAAPHSFPMASLAGLPLASLGIAKIQGIPHPWL